MISNVKSTEGIGDSTRKKGIHEGSESIMFSVLQETQYMYPFKSSVREIVSNCLDSITERNNSLKILKGELKVEDLFIEKEGTEFSGSRFNPDYYSEKWLSDNDMVTILYIENDTSTRDRIKFIDEGVGLGGKRLINYFDLGYSTKRLQKTQLGSFGLGAKSLLSTGVDFYTVTSRYEGREYSFNIFKDHVSSNIPKFEGESTINEMETFFEGEEDKEYKVYYRKTKEKNGVIVEAEVKRHRKMDFINSIENQLGFIENIELMMMDAEYKGIGANKRNIANKVLFSTDKLLVGESDWYAVPQILLKPGDDSNVMISYGTINFEELEMKKYSGNVSFIMNINDVDVTPSRENVIWNTRTRDAIKAMFLTAQDTVSNIIKDKIKGEENLPDFLTLLANFRNKNAISGIAELYKIIDVSKIDNTFKNFNIGQAGLQLSDDEMKKQFIFTSTEKLSSWGTARYKDTAYISSLSKDYISHLSPKNDTTNVVIYVGDSKPGGIGRYVADVFGIYENKIEVVYIKTELYEDTCNAIEMIGLEDYLDHAYAKGNFKNVLLGEVYRYSKASYGRLILESEIDKSKMTKLAKAEEEAKSSYYMSDAERAKIAGKVIGNRHSTPRSTYRHYYDENVLVATKAIIYPMADETFQGMFREAHGRLEEGTELIGFSAENFKRFYKVPGIRLLSNELFRIEFGDLYFTSLGKLLLSYTTKSALENIYEQDSRVNADFYSTAFKYLCNTFADFKIENGNFVAAVEEDVRRATKNNEKYLKDQTKERKKESSFNKLINKNK